MNYEYSEQCSFGDRWGSYLHRINSVHVPVLTLSEIVLIPCPELWCQVEDPIQEKRLTLPLQLPGRLFFGVNVLSMKPCSYMVEW